MLLFVLKTAYASFLLNAPLCILSTYFCQSISYHNEAISLPVAFEILQKLQEVSDSKTGKAKFVSEESKNEIMRQMLKVCCQNRLKFSYVLTDIWFSSKENMQYIKQRA